MSNSLKAFFLGLFIVFALALGAWLILFVKPSVGDGEVKLTVLFSNIEKISKGTLVTYGGKEVGEVTEIAMVKDPRHACRDAYGNLYTFQLTLAVDSSVKVYLYDEITFATAGLLGERSIAIIPKAPPFGAPPAPEVTADLLYARSTDRLEQTMLQIETVASTVQQTLEGFGAFIESNSPEVNSTLKALNLAACEMKNFLEQANGCNLVGATIGAFDQARNFFACANEGRIVERLGESFDCLHDTALRFSQGEGTIAQLVNSDDLYLQLRSTLSELQEVLSAMRNYGLLYQFSGKWQRKNRCMKRYTEIEPVAYGEESR